MIRLANGEYLILETKGVDSQQNQTKREYLDEWVKAVNNHGGFGKWNWAVSFHPGDLKNLIEKCVNN
jgi:type III restriction enzyme